MIRIALAMTLAACGARSTQTEPGIAPDPDPAESCATACRDAEPEPHEDLEWICGPPPTVDDCTARCVDTIAPVDDACGQCLIDGIVWRPQFGGCNEFECGCDDPDGLRMPRPETDEDCAGVCG